MGSLAESLNQLFTWITSFGFVCLALVSIIRPEYFDVVFSAGVVEHFTDPTEVIRIHLELMKNGGFLIIMMPNYANGSLYRKWYQRKAAKKGRIVAIKALSNKTARACYYIMRDQVEFNPIKLFG